MLNIINWFLGRPIVPPEPKPPAPCGNDKEHYYWIDEGMFPCPCCSALEALEQDKENKLKEQQAQQERDEAIAARAAEIVLSILMRNNAVEKEMK